MMRTTFPLIAALCALHPAPSLDDGPPPPREPRRFPTPYYEDARVAPPREPSDAVLRAEAKRARKAAARLALVASGAFLPVRAA